MRWVVAIFFLVLIIYFPIALNNLSDLDTIRINRRRPYFPTYIGKIFENKFSEALLNSRKRIFSYTGI